MSGRVEFGAGHMRCESNGFETFNAANNHICPSQFYSGSVKLTDNINITGSSQRVGIHDTQVLGSCAPSDNAVMGGVFVRQIGTARQSGFPQLGHFQVGGTCIVHTGWQSMDSNIGGDAIDYVGDGGTSGLSGRGQALAFSIQIDGGSLIFERHVYACWVDALPYSPNFYFRETWIDYNVFCLTVG